MFAEVNICNLEETETSPAILEVERIDRFLPDDLLAAKQSFSVNN